MMLLLTNSFLISLNKMFHTNSNSSLWNSPERLRITVGGDGHGVRVFSEEFILQKLVDTGISKYYTWDYSGDKYFEISDLQCKNQNTCDYDLMVQRYGNLKGSVISLVTQSIEASSLN